MKDAHPSTLSGENPDQLEGQFLEYFQKHLTPPISRKTSALGLSS